MGLRNILLRMTFRPRSNGSGAAREKGVGKETAMKRCGLLLAIAVFGAALAANRPASAAEVGCWYNGALHDCVWYPGYSYEPYPYGEGLGVLGAIATAPLAVAADVAAPLVTGRSVAIATAPAPGVAGPGNYCATPARTCLLREPGWLGTGCSCRVYGGYARGFVQ